MGDFTYLERFVWFDQQIRSERYPNACTLAAHFEISTKQARRTVTHLRDRFCAPLAYVPTRRGYTYADDSFELPRLPATQEELLAVLLARYLLSHAAGGHISEQIRRFGRKLIAGLGRQDLSPADLDSAFSAVWHGHSPVPASVFPTSVGMNRRLNLSGNSCRSVPHRCGDEPITLLFTDTP